MLFMENSVKLDLCPSFKWNRHFIAVLFYVVPSKTLETNCEYMQINYSKTISWLLKYLTYVVIIMLKGHLL